MSNYKKIFKFKMQFCIIIIIYSFISLIRDSDRYQKNSLKCTKSKMKFY